MGTTIIPVANFSPHPCIIQLGEVLGIARNLYAWLGKLLSEAAKMATLIDKLSLDWEKMKPPLSQEEEDELLGPKMAEAPKSEMLPFPDLAARLDILLEASPEIQLRFTDMIRKHQDVFGSLHKQESCRLYLRYPSGVYTNSSGYHLGYVTGPQSYRE